METYLGGGRHRHLDTIRKQQIDYVYDYNCLLPLPCVYLAVCYMMNSKQEYKRTAFYIDPTNAKMVVFYIPEHVQMKQQHLTWPEKLPPIVGGWPRGCCVIVAHRYQFVRQHRAGTKTGRQKWKTVLQIMRREGGRDVHSYLSYQRSTAIKFISFDPFSNNVFALRLLLCAFRKFHPAYVPETAVEPGAYRCL